MKSCRIYNTFVLTFFGGVCKSPEQHLTEPLYDFNELQMGTEEKVKESKKKGRGTRKKALADTFWPFPNEKVRRNSLETTNQTIE